MVAVMEVRTATHIEVEAGVRYWEDTHVNGVEDSDGTLIPGRDGDAWRARIRLTDGQIEDWPVGTTASIHYKVCDAGLYWLLDEFAGRIAKWSGYYVPSHFLCHGGNGYGDYIIMDIDANGVIENYTRPEVSEEDWSALK